MRAESTASHLRKAISQSKLQPGHKLNEMALANELEVSRNTLREAFSTLASEGIVTAVPYRGIFISRPTSDSVRDLYLARAVIEPGAVRWGKHIDVEALEGVVAEAEAGREGGRTIDIANDNQDFHRLLVAAMGSESLDEMVDKLLARMRLAFLSIAQLDPAFHVPFVDVNRSILELIKHGEMHAAAEELETSLQKTGVRAAHLLAGADTDPHDQARAEWL